MNILVTGCAGFIGYSLTYKMLSNNNFKIFGIDNLNKYYSPKLKNERLKRLKKYKNFKFNKIDLNQKTGFLTEGISFDLTYVYTVVVSSITSECPVRIPGLRQIYCFC